MSTIDEVRTESLPAPGSPEDPFRYGWRYVTEKQPDGRVELKTVPLTLRDLLFPQQGDFAVQYWSHVEDCFHLTQIFKARLAADPMAKILCDCRVRFDVPGLEPLGPDVAVFLNSPKEEDVGTLEVAETGARPILVVEVTSPDTRKNDFGVKKDFYHQARVPLYLIVDARPNPPKGRRVRLHGFRHEPEGYEPIPLDDRGRLWIEPLGIWLGIEDARVACYDGQTGERFADYPEEVRARVEAEARNRELEAQSAQDRANAAEAEARSAEAEARNRELEARIQQLEAELRRPRGEA